MRTHKVSQDVEDSDSDWRCREFKPQWGSDQPWSLELSNDFACDGTKKTACPPLRVIGTIVLVHRAVPAKLRSNLDINIYIHIYMYMCTYIRFGFVDKLESEKIREFVGMFWHVRPLTFHRPSAAEFLNQISYTNFQWYWSARNDVPRPTIKWGRLLIGILMIVDVRLIRQLWVLGSCQVSW